MSMMAGAVLVYLLVFLLVLAGAIFAAGYLLRKGWDRAGRPPR